MPPFCASVSVGGSWHILNMTSLNNGEPRSSGVRKSLEERMNDFEPLVVVERDGQEIQIPIAQFLREQAVASDNDDDI